MSRKPKQSRPQLVCILADNSDSMAGEKATLVTDSIRELVLWLQARGPRGRDRIYYRLTLIKWGASAELVRNCNMVPVRELNPEDVIVVGNGGKSDMATALELVHTELQRYFSEIVQPHSERDQFPLPVVVVFSDGWNQGRDPTTIARQIKLFNVDGITVPLVTVGVAAKNSEPANEELLRSLAHPYPYTPDTDVTHMYHLFDGHRFGEARRYSIPSHEATLRILDQLRNLRSHRQDES